MKAYAVIAEPASALTSDSSRLLTPLLIAAEFGLGFLVLTGIYWSYMRRALFVVFLGFACYALFLALQGEESCGCFGQLKVSPWWTFLLDVLVLFGLGLEIILNRGSRSDTRQRPKVWTKPCLAFGSVLSIGICIGLVSYLNPVQSNAGIQMQQIGGLTVLEPETWVGQKNPLSSFVDVELDAGEWIVLLHRHDCPKCQETIEELEISFGTDQANQIAIIEVPPYGQAHGGEKIFLQGRLTDDREWFVQTPVVMRIKDGIISSVSGELPSAYSVSKVPVRGS